jgi:hypothetical protein
MFFSITSLNYRVLRRICDLRGRMWWEAGEDCIMGSFITCTFTNYYSGDEMKEI